MTIMIINSKIKVFYKYLKGTYVRTDLLNLSSVIFCIALDKLSKSVYMPLRVTQITFTVTSYS